MKKLLFIEKFGGSGIFEFMKRSDKALKLTSTTCKPRDRAYLLQYEEALTEEPLQNSSKVSITARDGLKLAGRLYRKREHPKAIVIAVHGFHSGGLRDMGRFADMYYRNDFDYLVISQRSHEASEGNYLTFGAKESFDLIDWIRQIRKLYPVTIPIILHGVSMGAATVILAAGNREVLDGNKNPYNIKCCISDSAYSDIMDQISYLMGDTHSFIKTAYMELFKANMRLRGGAKASSASPISVAGKISIPFMFIHGKKDKFVPYANSIRIYEACSTTEKEIHLFEGAGHVCSYVVNKSKYEELFASFVKSKLDECD